MFPYRAPYTQSADMAPNCNFWKGILSFYPGSLFFSVCNHQKCSMQNSSGISAVSNYTNQNIYQDKQKKKKKTTTKKKKKKKKKTIQCRNTLFYDTYFISKSQLDGVSPFRCTSISGISLTFISGSPAELNLNM